MTTPTIHEKVLQAVTKALELLATLGQAKAVTLEMKRAQDKVRLDNPIKALELACAERIATRNKEEEQRFNEADSIARIPRDEALRVYAATIARLQEDRDRTMQGLKETCATEIAEAKRLQGIKEATAQAEVHTAEKQVAAIEATLAQYYRRIQEELGIDLKVLTTVSGR